MVDVDLPSLVLSYLSNRRVDRAAARGDREATAALLADRDLPAHDPALAFEERIHPSPGGNFFRGNSPGASLRAVTFSVTQLLPAAPAIVWPHLCEPDLMNRWSLARVELLTGAPCEVGTTRRIHVRAPLRTVRFDEVITVADAPTRLEYRVTGMRFLRRHHGVITLVPEATGARLRWDVDLAFALPGMAALARRIIRPQLARSLERLAALLRYEPRR